MGRAAYINGIGSSVPQRIATNDEIAKHLDTTDEWIASHTGIRQRHIASKAESCSELAIQAARQAIENASCSIEAIDAIIVATSTPDYPSFPATACIVQEKLGLNRVAAYDLSIACSGFVYGVELATAMIAVGRYSHVLLIGSEIFSSIVDWQDRSTCILFGDGAGAAVISAINETSTAHSGQSIIQDSLLSSEVSAYRALTREQDAEHTEDNEEVRPTYLKMNGKEVYLFAVKTLCEVINTMLQRNQLVFDDIDWVVAHQANVRIIDACCARGKYDRNKFYVNIDRYANTSAASIPIALTEMVQQDLLKRGDKILCIGFGAGLSFGANYIIW